MNPLTGISIRTRRVPPPAIDWATQPKSWLSLTTARLDGGFLFNAATLPVDRLFAETDPVREEVWIVDFPDGRMGVLQGEVAIVRAMLDGKSGLEVRRYRL